MSMLMVVLASIVLVPQPTRLVEGTGTCPTGAVVRAVTDAAIPSEGYRLSVRPDEIVIASSDVAGRFYAEQTLAQLRDGAAYPCVEIEDAPAFRWRGFMLDEGRHFFGKEVVRRLLDAMAMHKLNVLHWHLTEDQGWRLDVPGLPELAKYGSVRPSSPRRGALLKRLPERYRFAIDQNTEPYGPYFYTRADLKEIVDYAAARHITVVPEVDLPGHTLSALAAYPNLACVPTNIVPRAAGTVWGIYPDVLCLGNDETVRFIEKVLDYVCEVFPSKVIHIGGDECPSVRWEKCPKCRARMAAEGLSKPGELQTWITRQMSAYLEKKGRRLMGWDEILNGELPKSAIGQSWRMASGEGAGHALVSGAAGAMRGHDMVMSPYRLTYYAIKQGLKDDPFARDGGVLTLEMAYSYDPLAGVPEEARARVLGGEGCLWSEYIWNEHDLAWRAWPRACALAEVLWSNPAPRDYADFRRRMDTHRPRLLRALINCAPME